MMYLFSSREKSFGFLCENYKKSFSNLLTELITQFQNFVLFSKTSMGKRSCIKKRMEIES